MARTRGNLHSTAQDAAQRSRKKKKVARGEDSGYSSAGHGSSGGKRALYHHNYCEKDVTGKVRIKCAECLDFGLCAECFSVGAEVGPHKSNHPYRVMMQQMTGTEMEGHQICVSYLTRVDLIGRHYQKQISLLWEMIHTVAQPNFPLQLQNFFKFKLSTFKCNDI
ncbi:hypothetical protein POPTR_004G135400v4 [Populus trichocarpa]|uniref:Uncharacterized protein n=1 Tax=Populus trichocarpa TaxID=3694 RepID=A0ACC0T4K3_POPTR|nr:transcriptional adapter ADA2 isoform X2 [Populus trichocarpa]KAI9396483.1 hypothetical protein POPTR_004G135400v4 [Populus trichocarpa]